MPKSYKKLKYVLITFVRLYTDYLIMGENSCKQNSSLRDFEEIGSLEVYKRPVRKMWVLSCKRLNVMLSAVSGLV